LQRFSNFLYWVYQKLTHLTEQLAFLALQQWRHETAHHHMTVVQDRVEEAPCRQQRLDVDQEFQKTFTIMHRFGHYVTLDWYGLQNAQKFDN
jgi:ABC-type arginine transport system ATPase subunit